MGVAALLIVAVIGLVAVEFAMIKMGREIPGAVVTAYKAGAGLVIILALVGMALLAMKGLDRLADMIREGKVFTSLVTSALVGLLAIAAGYVLFMTIRHIGISPTLTKLAKIIFIAGVLGIVGCMALLWKLRETAAQISLETEHDGNSWLLATWGGFISVSFMFVMIMNPQLDLQTVFITRVQFIQSHAIFRSLDRPRRHLHAGHHGDDVQRLRRRAHSVGRACAGRHIPGFRWRKTGTIPISFPPSVAPNKTAIPSAGISETGRCKALRVFGKI